MASLKLVAFLLLAGASYFVSSKHVVEVYFIVEPSVIKTYKSFGYSQSDAILNIRGDMDYYVYQVNELFKSMNVYGLDIEIRQKKLKIMDKPSDEMFDDCILIRNNLLQSDMALEVFKVWLEDSKASKYIGYDIAVVMTGFDLFGSAGNNQVAGYATIQAACNPDVAVAVVEFDGTFSTAETLAHEIGHSLGAQHDASYECNPHDGYIMTETGSVTHKHRWEFSSCSAKQIKKYINSLDKSNKNCLLKTTTPAKRYSMYSQVNRDIFDASKICQRKIKKTKSFVCTSRNLYRNQEAKGDVICQMLYCHNADITNRCSTATPSEGMICDVGKRCKKGKCVNLGIPTPKGLRSDCLFRDAKQIRFGGKLYSCDQLVKKSGAGVCYSDFVAKTCCDTCNKIKKGPKDCPYGDAHEIRFVGEKPISCPNLVKKDGPKACYNQYIEESCCLSCKRAKIGPRGCEYGDRHTTCASYKDNPSDICYGENNIRLCCNLCRDYRRKRSFPSDAALVPSLIEEQKELDVSPQEKAEEKPSYTNVA